MSNDGCKTRPIVQSGHLVNKSDDIQSLQGPMATSSRHTQGHREIVQESEPRSARPTENSLVSTPATLVYSQRTSQPNREATQEKFQATHGVQAASSRDTNVQEVVHIPEAGSRTAQDGITAQLTFHNGNIYLPKLASIAMKTCWAKFVCICVVTLSMKYVVRLPQVHIGILTSTPFEMSRSTI